MSQCSRRHKLYYDKLCTNWIIVVKYAGEHELDNYVKKHTTKSTLNVLVSTDIQNDFTINIIVTVAFTLWKLVM